jgi:hypothetical protein
VNIYTGEVCSWHFAFGVGSLLRSVTGGEPKWQDGRIRWVLTHRDISGGFAAAHATRSPSLPANYRRTLNLD